MGQTSITGREYKLMLRASRFAGTDDALWHACRQAIRAGVYDTDGTLDSITRRRRLRFYDTPSHRLWLHACMVRERYDEHTGERELMLKYRHPDSNSRSPITYRKQAVLSIGVFALSRRGLNLLRLWPSHVVTRASVHSASSPTHLTLIFVRELLPSGPLCGAGSGSGGSARSPREDQI